MKLDSVVFYSKDIPTIVEFYTKQIGLELEYQQGDEYVSFLFGNNVRLGIKKTSGGREIPGSQTLILVVDDIESEYSKAKKRELEIYKELTKTSWGRTFSILDPDGNKLEYLQR